MIFTGYPAEKTILQTEPYRSSEGVEYKQEHANTKIIFNNGRAKVIILALSCEQSLNEHKTPSDTFLLMLEGEIVFRMNGKENRLSVGDSFDISENTPHDVTAISNSRFLLVH